MKSIRLGDVSVTESFDGVEIVQMERGNLSLSGGGTVSNHGTPIEGAKITISREDRQALADFLKGDQ